MKLFYTLFFLLVGYFSFAQTKTELTELNPERFSETGFTNHQGIEHKIIIKKPDAIYHLKNYTSKKVPNLLDEHVLKLPNKKYFEKFHKNLEPNKFDYKFPDLLK